MPPDAPGEPPPTAPGALRDWVWRTLARARQVGYPLPPHGHHPNFTGAAGAAAKLLGVLLTSRRLAPGAVVLSYPDMVLKPLRKRLLEAGVHVVVPAQHGPRYRLLRSGVVAPGRASSIAGAEREGELIAALPPLTFAFVACVAVSRSGAVLSKGYGFTLPAEALGLPSATLVHPLQVVPELQPDVPPVFLFATPEGVTEVKNPSAPGEAAS